MVGLIRESLIVSRPPPITLRAMGKTTKDATKKKQWMRISTARDFKTSHQAEMTFRASDRDYTVAKDGSWRRKPLDK